MPTYKCPVKQEQKRQILALRAEGVRPRAISIALDIDLIMVINVCNWENRLDQNRQANLVAEHPITDGRMDKKMRKCLGGCGGEFMTTANVRVCPECKRQSSWGGIESVYA